MLEKYRDFLVGQFLLVTLLFPSNGNGRIYAMTMATGNSQLAIFKGFLTFQISDKHKSTNWMQKSFNLALPNRVYVFALLSNVDVPAFCTLRVKAMNKRPIDLQYIVVTYHYLHKSKTFSMSSTTNLTSTHIKNGVWENWGEWSRCPGDCGTRNMKLRKRKCIYPDPECPGDKCLGKETQEEECYNDPCPLPPTCATDNLNFSRTNGEWNEWSHWSGCSNRNISVRKRTCDVVNVDWCAGNSYEAHVCFTKDQCLPSGLHLVNKKIIESVEHNKSQVKHQMMLIYTLIGVTGFLLVILIILVIIHCKKKKEKPEEILPPYPPENSAFEYREVNRRSHIEDYQELNRYSDLGYLQPKENQAAALPLASGNSYSISEAI